MSNLSPIARDMYAMDAEPVQGLTIDNAAPPPPGITLWLPPAAYIVLVVLVVRVLRALSSLSPLLTMNKFPSERGFRILIRICL